MKKLLEIQWFNGFFAGGQLSRGEGAVARLPNPMDHTHELVHSAVLFLSVKFIPAIE
jgi:hypothetical protein